MPTTLSPPAVELLERAVAYTRGRLAHVTPDLLANPTPCRAWDLGQLLAHLDDSLDAFTRAGDGAVGLARSAVGDDLLGSVRTRAGDLLGAWLGQRTDPAVVTVAGYPLPAEALLRVGALEIAVHGWDVGQGTGHPRPLPEELARLLLPVARTLVDPADRGLRFGPSLPQPGAPQSPSPGPSTSRTSSYDAELLGFLGRIA